MTSKIKPINLYAWKYCKHNQDEYNPVISIKPMPNIEYNEYENAKNLMAFIFNAIPYNTNQVWIEKLVKDIKSHLQNPESAKLIMNDTYHLENIIRISLNELTQE